MVKINSSHVFIAGGYYSPGHATTASYLYSSTSGSYSVLPDMAIARRHHACGLVNNAVWVGGGYGGDGKLESVELFSLESQAWREGPPLPIATSAGRMMTVDGSLLLFGNRVIWQLKTTGGEDYWDQVGEMETPG